MNRDLKLISVSLFTWGIGEGFFLYFQALYLQEWGASPVLIGTIFGAMGIAMALAQIPAGYLSDRFGPRPVMWFSWILGTSACWLMAAANTMTAFIVGLMLYGLTSFVVAPMNSYITSVRGKWSVGRALTFSSAMYNLGAVIGPILGGLVATRFGLRSIYSIAGGIFIISTLVILNTRPHIVDSHPHEDKVPNRLWRNPRFVILLGILFITLFATYLPQPLTPNYLQNERHLSTQLIGILGAVGSLGNAIVALLLGNINPTRAFLAGLSLVGVFSFLMWMGDGPVWFALGYFLLGGYRLCRSMSLAFARPLIRASETGLAFGMIETVNAFSIILAPVLAGFLYNSNPILMYLVALGLIIIVLIVDLAVLPRIQHQPHTTLQSSLEEGPA